MADKPLPARVTAHVVASFKNQAASQSLEIEGDPQPHKDELRHLLLFPSLPVSLATNVGTIARGSTRPIDVPGGIIQFSGGNTASLPREPVYSSPAFNVLFAFDTDGNPTGGETGGISPHYDSTTRQVRVNRACHAAVAYTAYKTSALELIYTPLTEATTGSFGSQITGQTGTKVTYGVVSAFHKPSRAMAMFDVQLTSLIEPGEQDVELYRIVSYAVTTPDGEFEMPPGYPTSGAYTTSTPPVTFVLDLTTHLRTERLHEIGRMRPNGDAYPTSYNVKVLNPFLGSAVYTIPKVCKVSTSMDPKIYSIDKILKAKNWIAARGLGCKP